MDKYTVDNEVSVVPDYHNGLDAKFKTFSDCYISTNLKEGKKWEPFLHEVFENYITKDSIVLEGGTHIGTHSVKLSKLCKFLYCFEALKPSFDLLEENLYINNCKNVMCFEKGLSDRVGKVRFRWERESNPGASALMGTDMNFFRPKLKDRPSTSYVKTIPIDNLNLPQLDFIKLDVEGYEKKVIIGAKKTIKRCRPIITLECYSPKGKTPTDSNVKNKFRVLFDMGYRFERLEHHTDLLFLPE